MRFKSSINLADQLSVLNQSRSQAGQDLFVVAMLQGARNKSFLEIGAGHPIKGNNTYMLEKQFDYQGISIDLYRNLERTRTTFVEFYSAVKDSSWPDVDKFEDLPDHIKNECIQQHDFNRFVFSSNPDLGLEYDWSLIRPRTKFIRADALTIDYSKLDKYYDYLQIDIEPEWSNWLALEKITTSIEFGVITFEHDVWRGNPDGAKAKANAHQLLINLGYVLVADDVTLRPENYRLNTDKTRHMYFEDWYVNPKYIDHKVIQKYTCLGNGRPKYYQEILFDM